VDWADRARRRLEKKRDDLYEDIPFECSSYSQDPVKRRLLVFIDGTNNDPSARDIGKQTNVWRLRKLVDESDSLEIPQKALYHEGVGSQADDPNYVSAIVRQLGGRGVDRILDETYLEVIEEYHPGDQLFILGFSRGATLARMLANRLAEDGIPRRGIARYHRYSKFGSVTGKPFLGLDQIKPEGQERIPIREIQVLGLWDSVASIGLLERLFERPPKLDIPDCVLKTYHLVSIDEDRIGFSPTLVEPSDRVEEVWFAGVHSDVGGGYREAGLANIALQFMKNRLAKEHGVRFKETPSCTKCGGKIGDEECTDSGCHHPNLHAKIHRHSMFWPRRKRRIRTLSDSESPRIHESAIDRLESQMVEKTYRPRRLLEIRDSKKYVPVESD